DRKLIDAGTEAALRVVRLAVHVVGDAAADRHEPGAGCDQREPAARREVADDARQADAGLAHEGARRLVEGEVAVELGEADDASPLVDGRVAVAAAETARDRAGRVDARLELARGLRLRKDAA